MKVAKTPLITVKTVKRKHLSGLRIAHDANGAINWDQAELIGLISEWDALLLRDKSNDHIHVVGAIAYYEAYRRHEAHEAASWNQVYQEARARMHALPQLLLD